MVRVTLPEVCFPVAAALGLRRGVRVRFDKRPVDSRDEGLVRRPGDQPNRLGVIGTGVVRMVWLAMDCEVVEVDADVRGTSSREPVTLFLDLGDIVERL